MELLTYGEVSDEVGMSGYLDIIFFLNFQEILMRFIK